LYGYVTRNDVLALLDQHIFKERIGYKLYSIDRENMRAGLQQVVRIPIAAGTVEVGTHRSDGQRIKCNKNTSEKEIEEFIDSFYPMEGAMSPGNCILLFIKRGGN